MWPNPKPYGLIALHRQRLQPLVELIVPLLMQVAN